MNISVLFSDSFSCFPFNLPVTPSLVDKLYHLDGRRFWRNFQQKFWMILFPKGVTLELEEV
jgi:hypothetical protein